MYDNSLSLKTLVSNAEKGITSRRAYVEETIHRMADMPLYAFIDRRLREPYTMNEILNILGLPAECLGNTFKDLIYVILAYKDSKKENLQKKAGHAMWKLADLLVSNDRYRL